MTHINSRYFIVELNDSDLQAIKDNCVNPNGKKTTNNDNTKCWVKLPLGTEGTPANMQHLPEFNHAAMQTEKALAEWIPVID